MLARGVECTLDEHLGDVVAVHAGLSPDEVALAQVDLGVLRPLVVEPAGADDRVGVAGGAYQPLGAALPVPGLARRVGDVHGCHQADVDLRPTGERIQQRGQGGVVVVLQVGVPAVGEDDDVDAVEHRGQ